MWLGLLQTPFAASAWCGDRFAYSDEHGVRVYDGEEAIRISTETAPTAIGWQPDCRRLAIASTQLELIDFRFTDSDYNYRIALVESDPAGIGSDADRLVWHEDSVAFVQRGVRAELRILDANTMTWVSVAQASQPVTDLVLTGPRTGSFALGERMVWTFEPSGANLAEMASRVALHPSSQAIEGTNHALSIDGHPLKQPALLVAMSADGSHALVRLEPASYGPYARIDTSGATTRFTIGPNPDALEQGWASDGSFLIGKTRDALVLDDGTTRLPLDVIVAEVVEVHVSPDDASLAVVKTTGEVVFVDLQASRSNTAAAPIPPPMHIETTP